MRLSGEVVLAGSFDTRAIAKLLPYNLAQRITHIKSGLGTPIHSLATGFTGRGISTTLIGGAQGTEPIFLRSSPLSVALYPKRGAWSFVRNGLKRERKAILELLKEIQPSIVHAHWTMEAGRAVADWGGPKVLTVHDAAWEYARIGLVPRPLSIAYTGRWLANTAATLRRFDHIIAVSPYLETYLRLKHRYRGEIRVIPNAILDLPQDLTVPTCFPKSGALTFGVYGNAYGIKNVYNAIKAFRRLRKRLPGARLLIFGGYDFSSVLQDKDQDIELCGAVPHNEFLKALTKQIDIWVHPSRVEAHPLSICEAIQAGCLVIAGRNSGGVAWTLDYGRAGILVDIENIDEISDAMQTAVDARGASCKMINQGQTHIQTMFNADRITSMHLEYYRDIAGR